jgi:hypothetical protein
MSATTTDTQPESRDFDFKRAECVLPARTSVFAYVDQRGDLRIWAQDSAYQCDAELRIPAEDIDDFINRLAELVGREPLLEQTTPKPSDKLAAGDSHPRPLTNAERARRYRASRKQRHENRHDECAEARDATVTQRDATDTMSDTTDTDNRNANRPARATPGGSEKGVYADDQSRI